MVDGLYRGRDILPLEQEVSRALAGRRAAGVGGAPVVRRAALLGLAFVGCLAVLVVLAALVGQQDMLRGDHLVVASLLVGLLGHATAKIFGGALSGTGRFARYGFFLATDSSIRLGLCVLFLLLGVEAAWPYALALAVAPLLALVPACWHLGVLTGPGPAARWREMTVALGSLLASSVLSAALLFAPAILVELMTDVGSREDVGVFNAALIMARVPIIVFGAVQIALLPQLSELAAGGHYRRLPAAMVRPMAAMAIVLGGGTVVAFLLGSQFMTLLFGDAYQAESSLVGVMTLGTSLYVVALTVSQGLIAIRLVSRAAASWAGGLVTLIAVLALADIGVEERLAVGYAIGCGVALAAMSTFLLVSLRTRAGTVDGWKGGWL